MYIIKISLEFRINKRREGLFYQKMGLRGRWAYRCCCCIKAAFCSWNLWPTRSLCLRNFSAHLMTQVSSRVVRVLEVKSLTQSEKHFSTRDE